MPYSIFILFRICYNLAIYSVNANHMICFDSRLRIFRYYLNGSTKLGLYFF